MWFVTFKLKPHSFNQKDELLLATFQSQYPFYIYHIKTPFMYYAKNQALLLCSFAA